MCFKCVEELPAFSATPECAPGRSEFAGRAGKSVMTRRTGDAGQRARLRQPAPAIYQNESGHDADPDGLRPKGK